jgi:hypothetical protein
MSNIKGLSVKNILKLIGALFVVLVVGCGGGGGSAGTSSSGSASVPSAPAVATPLFTSAPDVLTLGVGAAQDFNIGGGVAPYTAVSNNAAVGISGVKDQRLTIGGVSSGNSEITVRDSLGASVKISLRVSDSDGRALFTTAPAAVTVALASAPSYAVGGGTGPYTATSSNTSVATVSLTGSDLTISGVASGNATLVLRDSNGAVVNVAVTVVPATGTLALFTTAPNNITVAIGAASSYSVGGGTGPYTATSSNTSVATVSLTGSDLTISGLTTGTANIVIRDSKGAVVTVAVTVPAAGTLALFTTAPPAITVAIGAVPRYSVGGGTGPYTATSSNSSVSTVSLTGSDLTISGLTTGTANIVIRDSRGAVVNVAVTVPAAGTLALFTTAPSAVTIAIGAAPTYSVGGGTGPYTSTSNNARIATTTLQGNNLTITGVAVGSATISVRDSAGTVVNVNATIGAAPLGITPNSATGIINDRLVATITGGTAPFTVSVGNRLVASASVSGNQLEITLIQVGQTVVTVLDANNQSIPYNLTVNAATPGIRLSPTPLTVSELDNAPISLTVFGAANDAAGANVFSSDISKLIASISGTTVTLATPAGGNRCIPGTAPTGPDLNVTITVVDSTRASGSATVTIKNSVSACP